MARMSGADCVRALEASGFKVRARSGGITTLVRVGRMVVVPEVSELTADLLHAILRSAGISMTDLYGALAQQNARARNGSGLDDDPPSSI
jgi:predicted RNA binding protein YcfA (HicA-like mRNA interferase family)